MLWWRNPPRPQAALLLVAPTLLQLMVMWRSFQAGLYSIISMYCEPVPFLDRIGQSGPTIFVH